MGNAYGNSGICIDNIGKMRFYLPSCVRSPHHFTAKRVEKHMVETFHYFDAVVCPANGKAGGLFTCFTAAVDSYKEVVAAAFHV